MACAFQTTYNNYRSPLAPAVIVTQPTMSLYWNQATATSCGEPILLLTMPIFDREPETIPDIPGDLTSDGLAMDNFGVGAVDGIDQWAGSGVSVWRLWMDGVQMNVPGYGDLGGSAFLILDGTPGVHAITFSTYPSVTDWSVPHTFWLTGVYHDRPAYVDSSMGSGYGIVAFGPVGPAPCDDFFGPSIFWNRYDYWDPWRKSHHDVGDTNGPVDRWGEYLGLTGPWGADVAKQGLRHDCSSCLHAYACTLLDAKCTTTYPEITYAIETDHLTLNACAPPSTTAHLVFDTTRTFRVGS